MCVCVWGGGVVGEGGMAGEGREGKGGRSHCLKKDEVCFLSSCTSKLPFMGKNKSISTNSDLKMKLPSGIVCELFHRVFV